MHQSVHGSGFTVFDDIVVAEVSNDLISNNAVTCANFVLPSIQDIDMSRSALNEQQVSSIVPVSGHVASDAIAQGLLRSDDV